MLSLLSTMGSPAPVVDVGLGGTATPSFISIFTDAIGFTDALAWTSIGLFAFAILLQYRGQIVHARRVGALAWTLFGVFWLTMVPHYYYDVQSPLQSILSLAALPFCAYTGYLLLGGRDSLLLLSKAVAIMGLIYLPAETIPFVRQWLIETTAAQTHYGMELLGHSPGINEGPDGYKSRFNFDPDETVTGRTTYIVMACTGIGSMAIFGGLIAAVRAPLKPKLVAFAMTVVLIWFLNLVRNVFIGLASPWGWFQYDSLIYLTTTYMGSPANRTSFIVAHNFIAQLLAVVALVAITYLVIKILPEVLEPLEEVLYILTGTEYDLSDALGERRVGADGEGRVGDDGDRR